MSNKLRSFAISIIIVMLLQGSITANNYSIGDIIGDILYTDIVTYINGKKINSYSLNGRTAIVAEDLVNYGFEVKWNEESRELHISKEQGSMSSSDSKTLTNDEALSGYNIGDVIGHILYSDIVTYFNGEKIDSFSLNGRTAIVVEDLSNYGIEVTWDSENRELHVGSYVRNIDYVKLPDYVKHVDREKYQIYKPVDENTARVRAVLRDVAVRVTNGGEIQISTDGINGEYTHKVIFNSDNFPNLLPGSSIEHVLLMPWTRNFDGIVQHGENWRLCIITNKSQIYHNFPSRAADGDGLEVEGDIIRFEESVVWDLPERKFPSKDPFASGTEYYFPCLPEDSYKYYPMLNTDPGFVDTYGNGGFGKSITKKGVTYPRFYVPSREGKAWSSFTYMGGYEPGDKLTLIGTYNDNWGMGNGCRICVFATDDGGRSWYNKYEFADPQQALLPNWCNGIDTSNIAEEYISGAFKLKKRTINSPNSNDKEPANKFSWGEDIVINSISKSNPAIVTTSSAHGLATGDVIAISGNTGNAYGWDWMRNDTISANSGGNGILFKVEKIDDTSFKLYEYVHSPNNNISARHIHAINRCKDGWTINCGEAYPDGWILYTQVIEADTYAVKLAYQNIKTIRLTSSEKSVQRTMGSILLDDEDGTILFASDNETSTELWLKCLKEEM